MKLESAQNYRRPILHDLVESVPIPVLINIF